MNKQSLIIQKGNLIEMADNGEFDIIIHGCNCFHTMGGGIARSIRNRWPEAYEADKATEFGSREKLGKYSSVITRKSKSAERLIIVNAYTQFNISSGEDVFDYDAFDNFIKDLVFRMEDIYTFSEGSLNYRIGIPLIGCGLAGGDKERIMNMLHEFANLLVAYGCTLTLVLFE